MDSLPEAFNRDCVILRDTHYDWLCSLAEYLDYEFFCCRGELFFRRAGKDTAVVLELTGEQGLLSARAVATMAGQYGSVQVGGYNRRDESAGVPEAGAASLSEWGGDDRIGQARVYDYIARKARSVRHVGSRSGNLELMSLIGHKVLYFEEANSIGGSRMEEFQKHDEGLPEASPDRLNYKRVIIDRPLTFKGRFERGGMDHVARLINNSEESAVIGEVRRLLPITEAEEGIDALKEQLVRWQNMMLEIMQGREKGEPEFWETDDSPGIPQAVRSLLEKIARNEFETKIYETADSPRARGMEFELRKYLEQMFMMAAVFRKSQLVRERLQEDQLQEDQSQGELLLPRDSKFHKDESWYADFLDKIMRALGIRQGE